MEGRINSDGCQGHEIRSGSLLGKKKKKQWEEGGMEFIGKSHRKMDKRPKNCPPKGETERFLWDFQCITKKKTTTLALG